MGLVAIVEFRRCVTGARIFGIVVSELGYRQEPCPVVLLEIHKSSKISLYAAVLLFAMAISLWVEGNGKPSFDPQEVTER